MQESICETKSSIEISTFQCFALSLGFQMKVCSRLKTEDDQRQAWNLSLVFVEFQSSVNRVFNSIAAG